MHFHTSKYESIIINYILKKRTDHLSGGPWFAGLPAVLDLGVSGFVIFNVEFDFDINLE